MESLKKVLFLDGDSLYYLVNYAFYDENIRLENVTIQNGRTEYGEGNGTGIRLEYYSNGIVKNATIKDNIAIEGDAGNSSGNTCCDSG